MLAISRFPGRWRALLLVLAVILPVPAAADIVREEEAVDPHLRLDLPGHTGVVQALAFSADSSRLISGGRDKLAIVWQLPDEPDEPAGRERDIVRRRLRERAIRWQVARGPRGTIQALAASPAGDPPVVAVAGLGAMGSTGEIVLVDARDGSWIKTLCGEGTDKLPRAGHRQSVKALAFTSDGGWLVSQDLDGQVFAWKRAAGWQPVELVKREEERLGAAGAQALLRMPPLRPLVTLGADRVAIPVLVSTPDAETPIWKVGIFDLARPQQPPRLMPPEHLGVVTALAATPDGRQFVSADFSGQVVLHDSTGAQPAVMWEVKPVAESLAILPDGNRVAVGVATGSGQPAQLEVWDLGPPRRVASRAVSAAVRAVCASPDGRWLAWTGGAGHAVTVERTDSLGRAEADVPAGSRRTLGGIGQQITRVAFSRAAADEKLLEQPADGGEPGIRERNIVRRQQPRAGPAGGKPPRRIAVARAGQPGGQPPFDAAFDLQELALSAGGEEADWAPAAGRPAGWTLTRATDMPSGVERWQLAREGRPGGIIDLAVNDWQGRAGADGTAIAWLAKDEASPPFAVAIGTSSAASLNGIFIYRLEERPGAACRLLRWFRGHENGVLSLAVSEDGRWLASGGADGIAMLWSLSGIDRDVPLTDRWGISLEAVGGRAVVAAIDEAGPLAGKDVRKGDAITKLSYRAGKTEAQNEPVDPAAIQKALAELPWNTNVVFTVERAGKSREFNRNPAWENIAAVYLAADREWSFWTPRGYYAASDNGDRLFGWLVNRGIDRLPRFFRAQQFRRKLERPDVVSRLLVEGSLEAALRAAGRDVPEAAAAVLPQQMAQAVDLKIIAVNPGEAADAGRVTVQAQVEIPEGGALNRIQAFASGVAAAAPPRLIEDLPAAEGRPRRQTLEFELLLPDQDRHLVTVFAATREGPTETKSESLDALPPPRDRVPRIYVVAAGVDRYANASRWQQLGLGFDDLLFAVKDADAVREALSRRTLELYELGSQQLLADTEVTRDGWKSAIRRLVDALDEKVQPDDLLVLFLSGHGLTNVEAGGAYSFLCHDAELSLSNPDGEVVPTGSGAISWADFSELASVPCRKLALVDTCHSGALGPATRSPTVREFQENMIVVLAAAADDQPSQEADIWGHGAFTKALLEGLAGKADIGPTNSWAHRTGKHVPLEPGPDGIVSLDELIDYVCTTVPVLTKGVSGKVQNPQASPTDLLEFVRPALARTTGTSP
ncbi:MAG: hypothetical protein ACKOEM_22785 [Planctomycetia bacterium]